MDNLTSWVAGHVAEGAAVIAAFGSIAAAVSTVVLAWLTRRLAQSTERMADATLEQAKLTRRGLDAGILPLLVDVPYSPGPSEAIYFPDQLHPSVMVHQPHVIYVDSPGTVIRCSIPLKNVGVGVAVIKMATLRFGNAEWSSPRIAPTVVERGQVTRMSFSIPVNDPGRREILESIQELLGQQFLVDVHYTNIGDSHPLISQLEIHMHGSSLEDGDYYVRQVRVYEAEGYKLGESTPFIESGPSRPLRPDLQLRDTLGDIGSFSGGALQAQQP